MFGLVREATLLGAYEERLVDEEDISEVCAIGELPQADRRE